MSPFLNSIIVPLTEVPQDEARIQGQETFGDAAQKPLVLIVDDEALVADTLSAILTRAGFSTVTAYSGSMALEQAGAHAFDLLISDVAMPYMNGLELALTLLQNQPECKVLLFSGHATGADLVMALDAGHDFKLLAKPVHPTEMLRSVTRLLGMPEFMPSPMRMAEVVSIRRSA